MLRLNEREENMGGFTAGLVMIVGFALSVLIFAIIVLNATGHAH